jgi:invasion protein IalB
MLSAMKIILALLFLLGALPANAAIPVGSQQHRAWAAFSDNENGAPTCYMAARPVTRKGAKIPKDNAFVYITHRPAEKSLNVFHYDPGVELLLGSTVTAQIDGDKFTLFSATGGAWARGSDTDRALVEALRKGKRLTITATTENRATITDSFSLSGSGLALDAINKMCGVG